ncbi:MAG: YIP1 family protein [Lysobacterales bacterium]|jgi:hypothetical protein
MSAQITLSLPQQLGRFAFDNAAAWQGLDRRPRPLAPLLILLGSAVLLSTLYYLQVDIEWLRSDMSERYPGAPAEAFEWINRRSLITASIVSLMLSFPLMIGLEALLFFLVARLRDDLRSFGHWFAFAAWCALPGVLGMLAGLLLVVVGGERQRFEDVFNALSLLSLLGVDDLPDSLAALAGLFSAPLLLKLAVCSSGLRQWLGLGWPSAIGLALLPTAALIGLAGLS